jgi:hypothetical protein
MDDSIDKTVRVAAFTGAGCLVMLVCFLTGAGSAIGGIVWAVQIPEDVLLAIDTPAQVEIGDEVLIEIKVANNSAKTIELSSIDISTGYLEEIEISSSTPLFESTMEYEDGFGMVYQTYYFYLDIPAGESLTVTLKGKAMAQGNPAGEIDVCVNSVRCFDNILKTIVR